MNGIILASNIQTIISCEADDSLINATYLIITSIDIAWSGKDILIAFSKHKFYWWERVHIVATNFLLTLQPLNNELYFIKYKWSVLIIHQRFPCLIWLSICSEANEELRFPVSFLSVDIPFRLLFIQPWETVAMVWSPGTQVSHPQIPILIHLELLG
jgi:hypothetical protein